VEFHPAIQRLLNLSQTTAQAVPTKADPVPSMDSPDATVEAPTPAASQPAVPAQEPQHQVPSLASQDGAKGGTRPGSLKQTAQVLKERLFGDLHLLLGWPKGASSSTAPWGTLTLPVSGAVPAQPAYIT
jgi:hypothetical protein